MTTDSNENFDNILEKIVYKDYGLKKYKKYGGKAFQLHNFYCTKEELTEVKKNMSSEGIKCRVVTIEDDDKYYKYALYCLPDINSWMKKMMGI